MKAPPPPEETEQAQLFAWFNVAKWHGISLGELCYAVPNGAQYGTDPKLRAIQAAKMARTGLKPGVPDVVVPIPSGRFHGLYVEMKRRHGHKAAHTPEQRGWQARLRWLGHDVRVCEGADHAKDVITKYLAQTGHPVVIGWAPHPQIDWSTWEEPQR